MSEPIRIETTLGPEAIEAIAQRVLEVVDAKLASKTPSPYLTVEETAQLLRCARARVDNLLSQGRLTRVKDGRRTLIERSELDAYLTGAPTGPIGRKSRLGR